MGYIKLPGAPYKELYIFFGYKEFPDYLLQILLDYKYIVHLSMPKETDSKDLHFIRSFRLVYL